MLLSAGTSKKMDSFNKYGLDLQWPRIWILIIGILMVVLTFCIAGMEVGHTVYDLRRSTAFGGFITFLPLLLCAILVIITGRFTSEDFSYFYRSVLSAFKSRLFLVRIAVVICCLMIVLCMALIAYDILVVIDPTRCFFLDCSAAIINISNATLSNITVTGWPIYITWPAYFQTAMNAKRIFQGIQISLGALYILLASLYILTYVLYRTANLYHKTIYSAERPRTTTYNRLATPAKHSNHVAPQHNSHGQVTTYMIAGEITPSGKQHSSRGVLSAVVPRNLSTPKPKSRPKSKSVPRPRASSVNYDRICTRCMREPRMVLTTSFERENYFSHLCASCNNEMVTYRRKGTGVKSSSSGKWKH